MNQVDDLDARFKHLQLGRLLFECRRVTVNRITLVVLHRSERVDRLADYVEHATERSLAHRHRDRTAGVDGHHAAHHAVSRRHRNRSHATLTEVLLHFRNHVDRGRDVKPFRDYSQRLVNRRQVPTLKLDVEHGTDDLDDFTDRATVGAHVSIRRRHTVSELLFDL